MGPTLTLSTSLHCLYILLPVSKGTLKKDFFSVASTSILLYKQVIILEVLKLTARRVAILISCVRCDKELASRGVLWV